MTSGVQIDFTVDSETADIVASVSNRIREQIKDLGIGPQEVKASDIIGLLVNLISWIEGYRNLSGGAKKDVLIRGISDFVTEDIEDPLKSDLLIFVRLSLPSIINGMVHFGNDAVTFLKKEACCHLQ